MQCLSFFDALCPVAWLICVVLACVSATHELHFSRRVISAPVALWHVLSLASMPLAIYAWTQRGQLAQTQERPRPKVFRPPPLWAGVYEAWTVLPLRFRSFSLWLKLSTERAKWFPSCIGAASTLLLSIAFLITYMVDAVLPSGAPAFILPDCLFAFAQSLRYPMERNLFARGSPGLAALLLMGWIAVGMICTSGAGAQTHEQQTNEEAVAVVVPICYGLLFVFWLFFNSCGAKTWDKAPADHEDTTRGPQPVVDRWVAFVTFSHVLVIVSFIPSLHVICDFACCCHGREIYY